MGRAGAFQPYHAGGHHPCAGHNAFRLGFSSPDSGYAIDLGLPSPENPFPLDPQIKTEAMWTGETLGRANAFAERRGPSVNLRQAKTGKWRTSLTTLSPFDSMVTHCAAPEDGLELLLMRERMRNWRFYDNLPADQDAPARRPQVMTYAPVLGADGTDLAAAIATRGLRYPCLASGAMNCGSVSQGNKIHVSWLTSVIKVSTTGLPACLA
jgi:predicted ATPase